MNGAPALRNTSAVRFAAAARALGATARAAGLTVPAFRSPPRLRDTPRTIRRYPGGTVVAVVLRDRSFEDVVTDMVDGVLVANRLGGEAAARVRKVMLEAASPTLATDSPDHARVAERQTQAA